MIFAYSDWATRSHPHFDDPIPPSNKHYDWCKENLDDGTWEITFHYPYYRVILEDENATLFKLMFDDGYIIL